MSVGEAGGDDADRLLFAALDAGGKGYVTMEDWRAAIAECAPRLVRLAPETFAEADTDGNSMVGLREFLRLVRVARRAEPVALQRK